MTANWLPIGSVAFALAVERGDGDRAAYLELLTAAYLELLTDLAGGAREAVGISRSSGAVEAVPRHLFAFAEPGEGLDWADRDQFMEYRGDIIVDFRCDALGAWDPCRWEDWVTRGGYRVLYSDVRVSPPELPKKPAGRGKPGGGNTRYDDTAVVALAKAEYTAMAKPSKRRAAAAVVDRLIVEGKVASTAREAWIERIRKQV